MSEVNVVSRVQRIVVEPGSKAVSIINSGPIGPAGPAGISGVAGATTLVDAGTYYTSDNVEGALQEVGATTVASTADATQALADAATADAKAVTADAKAVTANADADAAQADATQALADAAAADANADTRVLKSGDTMTGSLVIAQSAPILVFDETDIGDDSGKTHFRGFGGNVYFRKFLAAGGGAYVDPIRLMADGSLELHQATLVKIPDATADGQPLAHSQSDSVLAGLTSTADVTVSDASPLIDLYDTDGTADERRFRIINNSGFINLRLSTDAKVTRLTPFYIRQSTGEISMQGAPSVLVPDATEDGEALAYDQSGWQLDSGTVTGVVTFTDSTDHPIKLDAGVGELGNIRYQRNGVNKFAVGLNSANDEFRIYADDLGADAVVVATGGAVDMSLAPSVVIPAPIYPDSAAQLETVTDAVAEAAVYTDEAIANQHATATAIPPVNPRPGQSWVMTPVDHIAMYTASGWKPVWPQTDNQAVTTGNAFNGVQALWVASEGD